MITYNELLTELGWLEPIITGASKLWHSGISNGSKLYNSALTHGSALGNTIKNHPYLSKAVGYGTLGGGSALIGHKLSHIEQQATPEETEEYLNNLDSGRSTLGRNIGYGLAGAGVAAAAGLGYKALNKNKQQNNNY